MRMADRIPNLAVRERYHPKMNIAGTGFTGCVKSLMLRPVTKHYLSIRRATSRRLEEASLLDRFDRTPPMAGEAEVKFLDGDFRIVRPGAFVRCAVTDLPIPLEELKYWSVERQEAYATPEAVLRREREGRD